MAAVTPSSPTHTLKLHEQNAPASVEAHQLDSDNNKVPLKKLLVEGNELKNGKLRDVEGNMYELGLDRNGEITVIRKTHLIFNPSASSVIPLNDFLLEKKECSEWQFICEDSNIYELSLDHNQVVMAQSKTQQIYLPKLSH